MPLIPGAANYLKEKEKHLLWHPITPQPHENHLLHQLHDVTSSASDWYPSGILVRQISLLEKPEAWKGVHRRVLSSSALCKKRHVLFCPFSKSKRTPKAVTIETKQFCAGFSFHLQNSVFYSMKYDTVPGINSFSGTYTMHAIHTTNATQGNHWSELASAFSQSWWCTFLQNWSSSEAKSSKFGSCASLQCIVDSTSDVGIDNRLWPWWILCPSSSYSMCTLAQRRYRQWRPLRLFSRCGLGSGQLSWYYKHGM
jgi:hypothetical protein